MLMRISPRKNVLPLMVLTMVICGCAVTGKYLPENMPEKALGMIQAVSSDERIIATASIDVVSPKGHYPVRAALILQRPSYLRLELLPVIGTPDFFLTATPSDMKIFIPSRGEFYQGKPTAGNMAHFLPWSIGIEDMVAIFSGAYPPLSAARLSYESVPDDQGWCVRMKSIDGDSQLLWFSREGKILKLIRKGTDGKDIYRVLYEDYTPEARLAGKITIEMADTLTSISVRYSDVLIEPSKDPSVFELPVPPGSKIIHLR